MFQSKLTLLAVVLCAAALIAGCGEHSQDEAAAPATVATPPSTQPQAAPQAMVEVAGPAIDAAIPKDQVGLTFRIVRGPFYAEATDQVSFILEAANSGSTVLSSNGKFPVNFGLMIIGPDSSVVTPPGNLEFQRIRLPQALQPGAKFEFPVTFEAAPTIGGSVAIDGVQEGVKWFRDYGYPTLALGTFVRCADGPTRSLCTLSGTPVTPAK